MAVVTIRQLLDSGVHFGHQTRRWNPKMKRFIFTERSGIYTIDLQQSLAFIDKAYDFVKETVAHGGTILFVGTKKQAQDIIKLEASRCGMFYVNQRWLGGMLTNFSTVKKGIKRLNELEAMKTEGKMEAVTKKEALLLAGMSRGSARQIAGAIMKRLAAPVLVTLGAEGMLLARPRTAALAFPTIAKEVADVSGAGDTVAAAAALTLAAGRSLEDAADISNRAAGVAVTKVGTATVSPQELLSAL